MGMQSASVQQPINQPRGKGSGQSPSPEPQGNFDNFNAMMDDNLQMTAPAVMPDNQYQNNQYQQPRGKGGSNVTMPGQGGQPRMGMPNAYSNTIQPWDNASIQPQKKSGKGKG
jgi:hypothetical protein